MSNANVRIKKMTKILQIKAREVLDSRGIPTVEGRLFMDNGDSVWAQASSGSSVGKFEAVELRDGGERYDGNGVKKSVSYINDLISPKLKGVSVAPQHDIDEWLLKADGTKERSKLGTNTISVVSQLVLKAAAKSLNLPYYVYVNKLCSEFVGAPINIAIPSPIFNIINGGKHGTTNIEFQEFHVVPSTSMQFSDSLEMTSNIYRTLQEVLRHRNAGIAVSEEGGFAPNLLTNTDALEAIKEAILQKKYKLGVDVFMGLDCAANTYYIQGKYSIKDKPQPIDTEEYSEFLRVMATEYSLLILEDPFQEEQYDAWRTLSEQIGEHVYIVADDLSGGRERVEKALQEKACNAFVLKFNQVATMTEIFEIAAILRKQKVKTVFSQRLGETTDSIVADIAVGIGADFVKFGSPVRGERVAKYNRLLQIEEELLATKSPLKSPKAEVIK